MYSLIPKISTQIIYSAVLKIRNEDNSKIINNLSLLIGDSNINVSYEKDLEFVSYLINSNEKKALEVFYFKLSSIANDNYNRRKKLKKNNQ